MAATPCAPVAAIRLALSDALSNCSSISVRSDHCQAGGKTFAGLPKLHWNEETRMHTEIEAGECKKETRVKSLSRLVPWLVRESPPPCVRLFCPPRERTDNRTMRGMVLALVAVRCLAIEEERQ